MYAVTCVSAKHEDQVEEQLQGRDRRFLVRGLDPEPFPVDRHIG